MRRGIARSAIIAGILTGGCAARTTVPRPQPQIRAAAAAVVAPAAVAIIRPSAVTFIHADTEMAITASFRAEIFLCNSVNTAGDTCLNRALVPTATVVVPKSDVTGPAAARTVSMLAPSLFVAAFDSLPNGIPHVMTLVAVADPATGGINESARSAFSNPFFGAGRTPAAPTGLGVK